MGKSDESSELPRYTLLRLGKQSPPPTMNSPNMILHIIHPTKHPITPLPLTRNLRVMLRLMPRQILLTREPALGSLRATIEAAKEMFPVSVIMFA